jgi:ribosomal protein L12E/L44/L45/RPP1/RPP2
MTRWTQLDLRAGVVLLESEDPHALTAFAQEWSEVVALTLAPVLEDQELSEVLRRARQPSAFAAAHAADVPPETYPEDAPVAPDTTPGTTTPRDEARA